MRARPNLLAQDSILSGVQRVQRESDRIYSGTSTRSGSVKLFDFDSKDRKWNVREVTAEEVAADEGMRRGSLGLLSYNENVKSSRTLRKEESEEHTKKVTRAKAMRSRCVRGTGWKKKAAVTASNLSPLTLLPCTQTTGERREVGCDTCRTESHAAGPAASPETRAARREEDTPKRSWIPSDADGPRGSSMY